MRVRKQGRKQGEVLVAVASEGEVPEVFQRDRGSERVLEVRPKLRCRLQLRMRVGSKERKQVASEDEVPEPVLRHFWANCAGSLAQGEVRHTSALLR
eukprot:910229-Pelagomonas_calceolata.AAC.2